MKALQRLRRSLSGALRPTVDVSDAALPIETPSRNSSGGSGGHLGAARVHLFERLRLGMAYFGDIQEVHEAVRKHQGLYLFSTHFHERDDIDAAQLCLFCRQLDRKFASTGAAAHPIVYYCRADVGSLRSCALLLGGYMVLRMHVPAAETAALLLGVPFLPEANTEGLRETLAMLEKTQALGLLDIAAFDVQHARDLAHPHYPDAAMVGAKFLLFRGPREDVNAHEAPPPKAYVPVLKHQRVAAVVRLSNPRHYDGAVFQRSGIHFYSLYTPHAETPTAHTVRDFLNICEIEDVVAVHCRDGRGRAAVLVALWHMRHLDLSAREAVAWVRLCRPGALTPAQERFLEECGQCTWYGNLLLLPAVDEASRKSSTEETAAAALDADNCLVV